MTHRNYGLTPRPEAEQDGLKLYAIDLVAGLLWVCTIGAAVTMLWLIF